jgi:hypothetical protein
MVGRQLLLAKLDAPRSGGSQSLSPWLFKNRSIDGRTHDQTMLCEMQVDI